MGRIYLETNAIIKLADYKCKGEVFTSVFALFELISGMNRDDFEIRRANIKKIFDSNIQIEKKMIDQILCEFADQESYNPQIYKYIFRIAKKVVKSKNYDEFVAYEIVVDHDSLQKVNALSWLRDWDKKISTICDKCQYMMHEDKDYIKQKYKEEGIKGLAKHFARKYEDNMIDENRLNHASGFILNTEVEYIKKRIRQRFTQYNFRLFIVAQAVIFAKSIYIDGGAQDKNNPSDLLHLLYLQENDCLISNDKIYNVIAEGIDDFHFISLNKEKKLVELISGFSG